MGRCHRRWELRLNQSVKPHHLPQQMIQKPLWRGKVSFLCTSSKTRRGTHTRTPVCTHKRRHRKWEVSVSLRGLTLISWQRNTWPLFYFYQDHLRIDQVPTSLWHRHENKINSDVLFIYFSSPISVTLWDVSISGCLGSPSNIDAKSPLASVKQSDSSTDCICPCFSPPVPVRSGLSRYSITIFHIHSFPFVLSCGFSFSILPSPSISTSANLTSHLVQPSTALGPLVEHPLNSSL